MPRASTLRTTQRQRPAPYETRSASHNMSAPLMSPYHQQQFPSWEQTYDQSHMIPMYMSSAPFEHPLPAPHEVRTHSSRPHHQPKNSQSAPWTNDEDECLRDCKRRGLQWDTIHKQYFPGKSGNACRKRYERLEQKRRSTEWDTARLDRLAVAYKEMRPRIWEPLARHLGERWEHVEKQVSARANLLRQKSR